MQLLDFLEQYVRRGSFVLVQGILLKVDMTCVVPISSINDEECNFQNSTLSNVGFIALIVGGIMGMIILVLCTFLSILWIFHKCAKKRKTHRKSKASLNGDQ